MTARGGEPECRLVGADPAKMRRHAQRAADVGAERQRPETGRERRGRSAGRAARRSRLVPGIVRRPVDIVIALPVAVDEGHIGLAENDRTSALEARHCERVFLRHIVFEHGHAPCRRQAGYIIGLFDRDRHAKQRLVLAACQGRIRRFRSLARTRKITNDDGIEFAVESLDPGDELIGQFERRNLLFLQGPGEVASAAIGPFGRGERRRFCHDRCHCREILEIKVTRASRAACRHWRLSACRRKLPGRRPVLRRSSRAI